MIAQDTHICLAPRAFRSGILPAACLHLIAALPNTESLDYTPADSPLRKHLLTEPLRAVNGHVEVSNEPGLDVEANPDVVDRYRVA